VTLITKQQAITLAKLEQALAREVQDEQRTRYTKSATQLNNVVMRFGTISNLTYLRGVAKFFETFERTTKFYYCSIKNELNGFRVQTSYPLWTSLPK